MMLKEPVVFPIFALILIILMCAMVSAADGLYSRESYVKGDLYVTPHYKWAMPFDGGELEALFIVPGNGARNVWDLAQRMPLSLTVFEVDEARGRFGRPEMFGGQFGGQGDVSEERRNELNRILDDKVFDLIVIGNVAWSSIPMDIIYKISSQAVRGGAGVVMTNADFGDDMLKELYTRELIGDGLDLFQPFPFEALERGLTDREFNNLGEGLSPVEMLNRTVPYHRPGGGNFDLRGKIKGYRIKEGRFVSIQLPFSGISWTSWSNVPALIPGIPVNMRNIWQEEYYYMLLAKSCMWAAGKTPAARIEEIAPLHGEATPGEPLGVQVKVGLPEGKTPFRGKIMVDVRDAVTGRYIGEAFVESDISGEEVFELDVAYAGRPDVPLLMSSDAFIHVRLLRAHDRIGSRDAQVVDFGAGFVRVKPGNTGLTVKLDKDTYEFPEPIAVEIAYNPESMIDSVKVELYDSRGRIWERKEIIPSSSKSTLSLSTERTRLLVHGVRVSVYSAGAPAGTEDVFFTLRRKKAPEDYYVFVTENTWSTWNALRRLERVYEWGGDGVWDSQHNIAPAVVTALAGYDSNPTSRSLSLSLDRALLPEKLEEVKESGRALSAVYQHFNHVLYNTTDDSGPQVANVHVPALPLFAGWIKNEYSGDISRLNAAWNTDFSSFEDVTVAFMRSVREGGQVPAWVDYCRFVNDKYIEAQLAFRQAVREVDPGIAAGSAAAYFGHSLASLFRNLNFIMPYYDPVSVEMGRSLAKSEPPVYTGMCMGYGTHTPREFHSFLPWSILLAGNNSILYWSLTNGLIGDLVAGDTPGSYRAGWMMSEIGDIKMSGAGKLFNSSRRVSSGVAILYSEDSRRAQDIDAPFSQLAHPRRGGIDPASISFQEMLSDRGLSFDYISSECITEDFVLETGGVELLILPHVQSLSEKETERIKQFVFKGGSVLADVRPGIRDGRGRRLEKGSLDEVFGIKRGEDRVADISILFPGGDFEIKARADGATAPSGGNPLLMAGDIPLFIEHEFGTGRTILMNIDAAFMKAEYVPGLFNLPLAREGDPALASYGFINGIFSRLGIAPDLGTTLDGGPPVGVKRTVLDNNGVKMVAVEIRPVNGLEYPKNLRLQLEKEYQVVEFRSGEILGRRDSIELEVNPYDVMIFSLLVEPASGLDISAPGRVHAGDTVNITVRRKDAPPGGVVHFKMVDPRGVEARDYQKAVLTRGEVMQASVHLPYNCIEGDWELQVSDKVSGVYGSFTVKVEGRNPE